MAGDWIKMRVNLDTHPKVIEMATTLGTTTLHVVGMLWKVWSWADSHSIDGNAVRVTGATLDRFTGTPGFAEVLRNVGWLAGRDGALTFPRFAEHNGQTAKKRAETADRVRKHRSAKGAAAVTPSALPEKRREEKKIPPKSPQGGDRDLNGGEAEPDAVALFERASKTWVLADPARCLQADAILSGEPWLLALVKSEGGFGRINESSAADMSKLKERIRRQATRERRKEGRDP